MMMILWHVFSYHTVLPLIIKTQCWTTPARECFRFPPCCLAPGRIWRALVLFSCLQEPSESSSLVCEYVSDCDCVCPLDKGSFHHRLLCAGL